MAGLRQPLVPDGVDRPADARDVVAMREDGVALRWYAHAREVRRQLREGGDFDAADVVEVAVVVGVAADAVGRVADLPGDVADVRPEALPLRGDGLAAFAG